MKQENKDFLDATRHHYDTIVNAGYVRGLNVHERDGLMRIMREEFYPNYTTDMNCTPCIFDFVKLIYRLYDDWKAKQPIPTAEPVPIENVKATFPEHTPGFTDAHASLPSQDDDALVNSDIQREIDYHNEIAKATLNPDTPIKKNKNHKRK